MFLSWALFPVLLGALCLGLGLLLERGSGRRLPGPLLVPAGFAATMALAVLLTYTDATTAWALPILAALALAGYVLGARRLADVRPDPWAVAAAVGVFLVCAAPAVLSGHQTVSGSLVLPDTSNQLQLAEQLARDGRDVGALPESSFKVSVSKYLTSQYPVAAQATLGVARPLGFTHLIWLYQPFLAFMLAVAALSLYQLLAPWSDRRRLRSLGAFLAAQPALTYAFALQGSIKEIAAVAVFCLLVALVADAVANRVPSRSLLPVALAAVAMLGALGPTAVAYLLIPLLLLAAAWVRRVVRDRSRREIGLGLGILVLAGLALVPFASGLTTAYDTGNAVLSQKDDLGNLARPLGLDRASGVWLGRDFRYAADQPFLTGFLSIIVALAAIGGVVAAIGRRAPGPLLFIGALLPLSLILIQRGSPYADGKVLALASPALVLAAAIAFLALAEHRRLRIPSAALALLVGIGVVGSNVMAYAGVQNAPSERYAELLRINDRFSGQGPSVLFEYDEYAGYLLRDLQIYNEPESSLDYRHRPFRRPNGLIDKRHRPSRKSALDIDDLEPGYLQQRPLLVLRRSPSVSRPPANFERVFRGRYYDVWRRRSQGPRVLAHLPLGPTALAPADVAPCGQVRALARRAERLGGRLAYVPRPGLLTAPPLRPRMPDGWFQFGAYPLSVVPDGQGSASADVPIPAGGYYRMWMGGSFARAVSLSVDGRRVGSVSYEPGNPGQYFPLARIRLTPGVHRITFSRGAGDLRPGDSGGAKGSSIWLTPAVFSPDANERLTVQTLTPDRASELCGRHLDWIEIVRERR